MQKPGISLRRTVTMKRTVSIVLFLSALVLACAGSGDFDVLPGNQPVIHDAYAPSVIRPGTSWRVYLHAEDYDGDMKEIVVMVTQTGAPPFPTNIVKLTGQDTRELAGYLWLGNLLSYRRQKTCRQSCEVL